MTWNRTAAEASVACPQSGTSLVGVNQRSPKREPVNEYNERFPITENKYKCYIGFTY